MPEINFLRERRKKLTKAQVQDKKLFKLSEIGFGLTIAVFTLIFGVHLFFTQRLATLIKTQEQIRTEILGNEQIEKNLVVMVSKINILSERYKQRRDKQQAINYFGTVFGPNVSVKQIEFDGTDNLLTFTLSAKDVFSIDTVLSTLNSQEVKDKFIKVSPSNLRRTEEATYQISIAVVLAESK